MNPSSEFTAAAFEFQRYLSDQMAPLMLVEEFEILLRYPPVALIEPTMNWAAQTVRPPSEAETADRVIHAVRKIAMMGEFDLLSRAALSAFLDDYCRNIVEVCPVSERERLTSSFATIIDSLTTPRVLVEEAPALRMAAATARRMEVFLDQLAAQPPGPRRDEVASEFMVTAALEASTREELDTILGALKGVGIDPATENVLNSIAQSLPGWGSLHVPLGSAPRERLGAMRQIVSLGEEPEEVAKRFREMVHAAIARFNDGDVGRAQSVLVLAQQMITEERVQKPYVESLRHAAEYLDIDKLRATAEKPESLPALRTIMSFFHALSPAGLLNSMRGEADENRRNDLSALVEVHGAEGRAKALELLERREALSDVFFAASALRILRRMPRPAETPIDQEIATVLRHVTKGTHPLVATQAIYFLGQAKDDRAERALVSLLRTYEGLLTRTIAVPPGIADDAVSDLLDRTCDALGRSSSSMCLRALIDHGMKTQPELGDCAKRLAEGAHADFSKHPELMNRLVEGLREELPRGLLGLTIRRGMGRSASFVRALSGTATPQVKTLFQEIVKKHGNEESGTLAAEALQSFSIKARPVEVSASTFSGDLGFFGLPMLLQTLGQGNMTGLLTLIDGNGALASKLWLREGKLSNASFGRLSGESGLYELLIRPFPGTFAFVHRKDAPSAGAIDPPGELMTLIFEGVRRHDEWQRASALVGDDARFTAIGDWRGVTTDESADFVEALWAMASSGSTAKQCETRFPVDSHRTRKLLASWVENDVLKLA